MNYQTTQDFGNAFQSASGNWFEDNLGYFLLGHAYNLSSIFVFLLSLAIFWKFNSLIARLNITITKSTLFENIAYYGMIGILVLVSGMGAYIGGDQLKMLEKADFVDFSKNFALAIIFIFVFLLTLEYFLSIWVFGYKYVLPLAAYVLFLMEPSFVTLLCFTVSSIIAFILQFNFLKVFINLLGFSIRHATAFIFNNFPFFLTFHTITALIQASFFTVAIKVVAQEDSDNQFLYFIIALMAILWVISFCDILNKTAASSFFANTIIDSKTRISETFKAMWASRKTIAAISFVQASFDTIVSAITTYKNSLESSRSQGSRDLDVQIIICYIAIALFRCLSIIKEHCSFNTLVLRLAKTKKKNEKGELINLDDKDEEETNYDYKNFQYSILITWLLKPVIIFFGFYYFYFNPDLLKMPSKTVLLTSTDECLGTAFKSFIGVALQNSFTFSFCFFLVFGFICSVESVILTNILLCFKKFQYKMATSENALILNLKKLFKFFW